METINKKLDEIFPYDRNPRYNEQAVDSIAKSIKEFGFLNPIVVDSEGVIICGHTRYSAAKKLGMETVPVIVADKLNPDQVKAYRIADNKTSELATWNYEQLIVEIKELQDADYDISNLGFANDVLEELLYHEEDDIISDGETDPDYIPELPDEIDSKLGETYELGEHRILCCPRIDKSKIQTFMFDGNAKVYFAHVRHFDNDSGIGLMNGSSGLAAGGVFYIMHQDEDTLNMRLVMRGTDLEVHETLLWLKSNFKVGEQTYQMQNDCVLYGWKPGASHKWYSDRKQCNLLQYNNAPSGMPPVSMSVYLIRNSTVRGEIVLDNFSNTGNTLIACEQTGRRARVIANDERTCDLIRCRWAQFVHGVGCDWKTLTKSHKK